MKTDPRKQGRRYPLHVTISLTFAGLMLLFGSALIAFNYVESRRIALLGADEQLEQIGAKMRSSVSELYRPAQNLVDISSRALPSGDSSVERRLRSLSYFAEALRLNQGISSVFVGYEDGDFLLVRHSQQLQSLREQFDVPPGTSFVVQNIERQDGQTPLHELIFLDSDLQLLSRRSVDPTGYDPRDREWFQGAMAKSEQFITGFYRFFTTGEVGVTIARRLAEGGGVVGVDLALSDLATGMAELRVTPSTHLAMFEPDGGLIVADDPEVQPRVVTGDGEERLEMPHLSELEDPLYLRLDEALKAGKNSGKVELEVDGEIWLVDLTRMPTRAGRVVLLASMVPRAELLEGVARVRDQSVLISLGLLAVALVLVVGISRHISASLRLLAREAQQIRELRLDTPLTVKSDIEEVNELAETMAEMKSSLQQFLAISQALSGEKNFERLLTRILDEARRVSRATGGAILLRSEDDTTLEVAILHGPATEGGDASSRTPEPVPLDDGGQGVRGSVAGRTIREGRTLRIDDASRDEQYDLRAARSRFATVGCVLHSLLSVPLRTQQGDVIGVLQLACAEDTPDGTAVIREEAVPYIEALSSNAAVALDNRRLLKAQKDLLESFIHVVAGAIDSKSPYTHGHCSRVPVVARMLAEAAHESEAGALAGFRLSDDEWYELHLASWLHDCGKVTTPEYVVDKATKLETIYNRIHEVRMRFEVLWRDAMIEYLEASKTEGADPEMLRRRLEQQQAEIREDFEFVAECNRGGEFMSEERLQRIRDLASKSWRRHLDDRLGLSQDEMQRIPDGPAPELPVLEPLLADKPEQIVPRCKESERTAGEDYGFQLTVPEHMYNRGELYNLSIARGTLTFEERYKINEHIIETIRMLKRLPFPRELRRVPDWAGNHHEKLDGTGYPRGLQAAKLTTPDRIMAIADIFEALTATDRPYMQPKKLSQAIRIMGSMCESGHICPDLFALFLESGVHLRYAEKYLQAGQIDEVDIGAVLS